MLLTTVGFATLWAAGRATNPVLAMARTVHRGEVITAADLTVAHALADPAIHPVAAASVTDMVGKRAALDLPAGSLLTADAITADPVPGAGAALVGLRLTPGRMPLSELAAGDPVTIVMAGRDGEGAATAATPTVTATVVGTGTGDDGARMVDVTVPAADAATVTSWVATGRVAIYRDSEAG